MNIIQIDLGNNRGMNTNLSNQEKPTQFRTMQENQVNSPLISHSPGTRRSCRPRLCKLLARKVEANRLPRRPPLLLVLLQLLRLLLVCLPQVFIGLLGGVVLLAALLVHALLVPFAGVPGLLLPSVKSRISHMREKNA